MGWEATPNGRWVWTGMGDKMWNSSTPIFNGWFQILKIRVFLTDGAPITRPIPTKCSVKPEAFPMDVFFWKLMGATHEGNASMVKVTRFWLFKQAKGWRQIPLKHLDPDVFLLFRNFIPLLILNTPGRNSGIYNICVCICSFWQRCAYVGAHHGQSNSFWRGGDLGVGFGEIYLGFFLHLHFWTDKNHVPISTQLYPHR